MRGGLDLGPGCVGMTRFTPPASWRAQSFPACLLEVEARVPLRAVPGRETFVWPEVAARAAQDEPVIVKRTRGDRIAERWHELYQRRARRSPGEREFENLEALAQDGVSVPRALAWCAQRSSRRSLVVMELVQHRETLRQRLERRPQEVRRWLQPLLELVAGMHEHGWYHRDLYLEHIVLRAGGAGVLRENGAEVRRENGTEPEALVLLDVGRARREREPRRRWWIKDLAALLHSTPAGVSARERLRFLARYLDRRGVEGRAERRRWLRKILDKRARIAAHAPRHVSAPRELPIERRT